MHKCSDRAAVITWDLVNRKRRFSNNTNLAQCAILKPNDENLFKFPRTLFLFFFLKFNCRLFSLVKGPVYGVRFLAGPTLKDLK